MKCVKVIRAVRAVLQEAAYAGRFDFVVYPWEDDKSSQARDAYGFGPDKHGLALVGADGKLLSVRPGHEYGKDEIRADLDKALAR